MLLFIDPPQHTRVRRLVAKAFTPRRVEALRPRLTAMVEGMLDRLERLPSFDVMDEIAEPFPIMTITELLGVPDTDGRRLHDWTVAVAAIDELPIDLTVLESAGRAADEFLEYARQQVDARRAAPGDDLISALILAEDEGEHLTQDELLAMIVLLLVAGHDTTMSLISTGLWLLLQHPEAAEEVRRDPRGARRDRGDAALHGSAAGRVRRWPLAARTGQLVGRTMPPGESVRLLLGSANRDPEAFDDPDRFDIHRKENRHVAFGKGLHFCIGAALARVEGQVVLPAVLRRFPDLAPGDAEPRWRPTFVTRQLARFPSQAGH